MRPIAPRASSFPARSFVALLALGASLLTVSSALGEDPVKMSLATLLNALQMGGGETVPDKAEMLVRAAVAAVLNAEHPDVAYGLTSAWIVAAVHSALDSRDATAIIGLAGKLDKANNGENGCPLN